MHVVKDMHHAVFQIPGPHKRNDRIKHLRTDDPLQQFIFVLKMIVEGRADNTRPVCYLLDRYLIDRHSERKILKALCQHLIHIGFGLCIHLRLS